jgi:hypothetical protein
MDAQEWANLQEALLIVLWPVIGIGLASMVAGGVLLGIMELIRDLANWILHLASDPD